MKVCFIVCNWLGLICWFGLIEFVDGIVEVMKEEVCYFVGLIDIVEVFDV